MADGWIGVDLDGTLAVYDTWKGSYHIGEPIMPMVNRVKKWLEEGKNVRIFTARVGASGTEFQGKPDDGQYADEIRPVIEAWCEKYIGQKLPITATKDFLMIELWDDRCVQLIPNMGIAVQDFATIPVAAHEVVAH